MLACRARRTSTRARSSASSRSTSRPRTARTRPGSAPARSAATAAGCRCRGRATAPPYGFGPGDAQPWIPQPLDWAALTVEAQTGRRGLDARALPRGAGRAARRCRAADVGRRAGSRATCCSSSAATSTIALNCGAADGRRCPPASVLLASGPVDGDAAARHRRVGADGAERLLVDVERGVVAAELGDERDRSSSVQSAEPLAELLAAGARRRRPAGCAPRR